MRFTDSEIQSLCLSFAIERMRRRPDMPIFDKPGIESSHTFSMFVNDYAEAKDKIGKCIKELPN